MSQDKANVDSLTDRCNVFIDTLANAMMATAEMAAERIQLAAAVAQARQRSEAFLSVLEAIGAQKEALLARVEETKGPVRRLLKHQLEMLSVQEVAVLCKAGLDEEDAELAVERADAQAHSKLLGHRPNSKGAGAGKANKAR